MTLALLGGLPMYVAIGTSLVIIALKSFAGFATFPVAIGVFILRPDVPRLVGTDPEPPGPGAARRAPRGVEPGA